MLNFAELFFVIALLLAVVGFGGLAGAASGIVKVLFFIFLVLFVVSLIVGFLRRGKDPHRLLLRLIHCTGNRQCAAGCPFKFGGIRNE